jgi:uncharacterized lipoprotein YbaY
MKLQHALIAAAAALLLAACGDNPADAPETPPPEATEVPASATVSATAYAQYAASLQASETARPLGVNNVTPPTSETEAPVSF